MACPKLLTSALTRLLAVPLLIAAGACGGATNGSTMDPTPHDSGVSDGSQASADASSGSTACTGTAPDCFGNDDGHCCGEDPGGIATCSGGRWMCGASVAPGCNGTACFGIRDAGAGCPGTRPADGMSCTTSQLACEYGADPAIECNTVVTCSTGTWSTTQTPFTGGFCTTTSAPSCPATAADVVQESTCAAYAECSYPNARCQCACPVGNPGADCSTDASMGPRTWQCDTTSAAATVTACPSVRPRLGTSCTTDGQPCTYAGKDGLACWGNALRCQGGVWIDVGGSGC